MGAGKCRLQMSEQGGAGGETEIGAPCPHGCMALPHPGQTGGMACDHSQRRQAWTRPPAQHELLAQVASGVGSQERFFPEQKEGVPGGGGLRAGSQPEAPPCDWGAGLAALREGFSGRVFRPRGNNGEIRGEPAARRGRGHLQGPDRRDLCIPAGDPAEEALPAGRPGIRALFPLMNCLHQMCDVVSVNENKITD